jgi:hypothetical protein
MTCAKAQPFATASAITTMRLHFTARRMFLEELDTCGFVPACIGRLCSRISNRGIVIIGGGQTAMWQIRSYHFCSDTRRPTMRIGTSSIVLQVSSACRGVRVCLASRAWILRRVQASQEKPVSWAQVPGDCSTSPVSRSTVDPRSKKIYCTSTFFGPLFLSGVCAEHRQATGI